jgi:hypothetical protein
MPKKRRRTYDYRPWTAEEVALLSTLPDSALAKRLGRTAKAVRAKRQKLEIPTRFVLRSWSAAEIALLGTEADERVAEKTGRTLPAIVGKRCRLGIREPAFARRSNARPPKWKWGPTELDLFRTYSDAEIAKLTCRPLEAVTAKRAELKIKR